MTDEEKDKTEKEYKKWLVNDHKLLDNPTYCDIEQKCFRAFFAGTRYGLAKGRKERWHDLKKNPNDLPKLEEKCNPWSITVANQLGEACHYNYGKSRWENPYFTEIEEIIAWCELPKFEE